MGVGTPWEGSYLTGLDKKYLQVANIDLQGSESNKWTRTGDWQGILDGNLLNIVGLYLNQSTSGWGMFLCGATSGDRTFKNIRLTGVNNSNAAIIGLLTGTLETGYICEDCEFSGSITTINALNSTGGICAINKGTIRRCKVNVTVTKTTGGAYIGGLVGYNFGGRIEDCLSIGAVNGYNYTGGLVGLNSTAGVITTSYSIGAVAAVVTAGGFCGLNAGTITNSYWDTETSGQATSAGGTGKTTAEMQAGTIPDTTIYIGWDDTIWDAGTTSEYPELINLEI